MAVPPRPAALKPPAQTVDPPSSVEHSIHLRLSVIAAIVALALAPALSFTLEKPLYVALPALAYGGVMLFVHREARRGRDYIKLSYYLALSVTAAAWFPASGSAGSVLLYQSAAMIYGMVIMRGRERAVAVGVDRKSTRLNSSHT